MENEKSNLEIFFNPNDRNHTCFMEEYNGFILFMQKCYFLNVVMFVLNGFVIKYKNKFCNLVKKIISGNTAHFFLPKK